MFKYYVQSKEQGQAGALVRLLEKAHQEVTGNADEADYIIEVRARGEASGAGKYNIGSATGSAIGDRAIRTGNVSGGNVVIGGEQTVTGDLRINSDNQTNLKLDSLLDRLREALNAAPPELEAEADQVVLEAAAVVEEAKAGKSHTITRGNLLKAATNIAAVMPVVGVIIGQIFDIITNAA